VSNPRHRAADSELRNLIAANVAAPAHRKLIGTVRRWLRKQIPTAHEVVYAYRDALVISFSPSERGYEGVFAIRAGEHGVRLYLNRGKGLQDPEKLLRGSAQARWIDVESAATLARTAVQRLVDLALANNSVPFARTGGGSVTFRATSANKA
jgi:hypothetical protein